MDEIVRAVTLYTSDSYELTVQPTQPLFQLHAVTVMTVPSPVRIDKYLKSSLLLSIPSVHELKVILYAWLSAFDIVMANETNSIVTKYLQFINEQPETPKFDADDDLGGKKLN